MKFQQKIKSIQKTGQKIEKEIDYFNKFGESLEFDAFNEDGYKRIFKELFKDCKPSPNLYVADFGCGTGNFTIRLSKMGFKVVGIDIAKSCIEFASKEYKTIKFEVGNIEKLAYPDATFDIITLFGALHHFPQMVPVLNECHRLLKRNGLLFAFDPHIHNPFYWLYRSKHSPLNSKKNVTENEYPLTKKQIRQALSSSNFNNYKVYCISGVLLNSRSKKFTRTVLFFLTLYNLIETLIDYAPFRRIFGSTIITSSRK